MTQRPMSEAVRRAGIVTDRSGRLYAYDGAVLKRVDPAGDKSEVPVMSLILAIAPSREHFRTFALQLGRFGDPKFRYVHDVGQMRGYNVGTTEIWVIGGGTHDPQILDAMLAYSSAGMPVVHVDYTLGEPWTPGPLKPADVTPPPRLASMPRDERGYIVPWFVAWFDGRPDFRVVDPVKTAQAVKSKLCFLCGKPLGAYLAFLTGPMCLVNRISAEPPNHIDCATYAAKACPFLSRPKQKRNEHNLPADYVHAGGTPIMRNPGVSVLITTASYEAKRAHAGNSGVLFHIGEPIAVFFFAEGEYATVDQIRESVQTGLPLLKDAVLAEGTVEAATAYEAAITKAKDYFPKGVF